MTYELYTISGAPRPWRVALALVAKGLSFQPRILDASRKEQKEPGFLALNDRGRTPVLVRDQFVLTESVAILAYLERAHPEPPLFGTSIVETARVWEQLMSADYDLHPASSAVVGPIFKGATEPTESLLEAARKLLNELQRLDARLAESAFLCGERITAADCVAFPEVRLTQRASERAGELMGRLGLHPLAETVPHVRRWLDRIEALPGYQRTFPVHWRS
ncbi:MAG: glutathione S-transferase family protein [Myxococcota bacterium]